MFIPPESFGAMFDTDAEDTLFNIQNSNSWDVATRYHEFKSKKISQALAKQLRRMSASAILERAQEILGSVVHPVDQKSAPMREVPLSAEQVELDLDETIDGSPVAVASVLNDVTDYPLTENEIWMSYHVPRRQPLVFCVDTSLSMTGEKLALTAVALAVVLLEFPEDPIGIIAFENEAKVLKNPEERVSIPLLVERFLDVPAQGYTHLEDGMKAALKLVHSAQIHGQGRPPSTVLLTDGKYTAGRDPDYLAPRFPHLIVLKMGRERASLELCRDLAKKGHGALREVGELEALPTIMYGVVKDLLRGRSLV
jgi:Mg-chelatase subunit ChlD